MKRYFIDAREMVHPEPLERSIAILKILDEESYLYMLHRMQPVPLLALAKEHRLNAVSFEDGKGEWHILISPECDCDLSRFVDTDAGDTKSA